MNRLIEFAKIARPRFFFAASMMALIGLVFAVLSARPAAADIALPKFFSDHMVLQQNADFPVWGVAESNQALVIRFNGNEIKTTTDAQGKFSVAIKTPAAGGPYRLEVIDQNNDAGVILDDVMVGEVWLCSGQSNMNWPVEKSADAAAEILSANNYNQIRLFTVENHLSQQPLTDIAKANPWTICSADNVKDFSAVGFFFGRRLAKEFKDTPIGLIDASWNGTRCEAWCSLPSLAAVDDLSPLLDYWVDIKSLNDRHRPGKIFNGMISPLVKYPLKGVLWYQGESNVGRGKQYATLLPTLIADWRQQFGDDDLPFYIAQLTPFRYSNLPPEALPEVWEAQLKTVQSVHNVAIANTMDVGENDQVHPKNKQSVGLRLAMLALAKTYQIQLPVAASNGPQFDSMEIIGDIVRVKFLNAGQGLKNLSKCDPIESFAICGEDQIFYDADVKEIGVDWVELVCPDVDIPVAVRYCWTDTAASLLGNSDGLPTFPFRTDDFGLTSQGRHF